MALLAGGAPMNIASGIREFAASSPDVVAVIDGDRSLTYRELEERSNRLAQFMIADGRRPGEPVALLMGNRLEYCEIAAGLAKAGLPMVPLNPRQTGPETDYIVGHSGARTLILDSALLDNATDACRRVDRVVCIDGSGAGEDYEAALARSSAVDPRVEVDELSPFCIAYTSGTTGRPKGVLISHRSRCLTFTMSALDWGLGLGRRSIAVAPLYHGAGFAFGYSPVYTGGTVSMLRSWDPRALLEMVQRDRAQSVFLVPAHAQMLRALGDDELRRYDLSSLDTLFFNAAALPGALKEWVLDAFPGCGVHELYGSTEAGIVTNCRPRDARRKTGSVGTPWFLTEVKVLRPDGSPARPGEPGELYSRSPYLMNGYLNDDEATLACTTEDGFLSSGDIVVTDDDGFITIVDRVKDVIITGGSNVYPREVEEVAARHPAVADVAVIGVPHELWGEQVVAYVVLRQGATLTPQELDAHLRSQLAGYKIPKVLHVVDALPRSAAGKVLKRELRVAARSG